MMRQICLFVCGVLLVVGFGLSGAAANQCSHGHHHHHARDENVGGAAKNDKQRLLLPEEIAEEEDLKMMWAAHGDHDHDHGYKHDGDLMPSGLGLWINAMGCSLLVSLASLICLILLPLIFIQGKPSKAVVDSLAVFGAGAMLGDAFLHQLPHAFGGDHSHSHDHHDGQAEHQVHSGHSHSLQDLSIGLSILAGIVVFLIVEKLVRYVDTFSGGVHALGHHHHHHKHTNKLKDDKDTHENLQGLVVEGENERVGKETSQKRELYKIPSDTPCGDEPCEKDVLRKRTIGNRAQENGTDICAESISDVNSESLDEKEPIKSQPNLVFGYLNLISDGVHNFTDGMALGSAFLLYGSVGGWSRTLFLLAHELPQEIGDFGILVRSGFTVSKALFFNFLSALVALAGTALAMMWGRDPGQSSLIEGFTAGGFIYIALAGVLAEMNSGGMQGLRSTTIQFIALLLGIAVALCISVLE
ncbi:IAA-alanine resistance protein 1 [Dorcoceras hygrometricum]|uniref:IAA-alanine resistance protein 1 n=1 Tax=Dorcoceras hygrometricum TaxID=472368 RepID=A0A2Z7A8M6_9LAMI|nr:IAA-alanine resistance protein 1 [Dorcoceras hygrometricum]